MADTALRENDRRPLVLVVDDEPDICLACSESLENEGFRTVTAGSFELAEKVIDKITFDCILCDIFIDNRNGLDLLKRNYEKQHHPQFVFITGFPTIETASEAVRIGAYDYLVKPVNMSTLTKTVRGAVNACQLLRQKEILEIDNQNYRESLEVLVEQRTRTLKERETQYRDLFENATDLIQSVDVSGKFLRVNKKWRNTMGYTDEEVKQLNFLDVIHPDHRASCKACFTKILFGHEQMEMETEFLTKSGKSLIMEGNVNCYILDGKPVYTRGIFRDISERRKAEQKIDEQRHLLTNVLESLTHPFFVIQPEDYTLLMCNSATLRDNHKDQKTCYAALHGAEEPCWKKGVNCPLIHIMEKKLPVRLEQTITDPEGNVRNYEIFGYPMFGKEEKVEQVLCYKMDNTERRRLESVAEAVNLMDNLGFIFSGIRHEIGNPVNSIKMALTVLHRNLDSYDTPRVREFVERALAELGRMEFLLKALKNFSMFENPSVRQVSLESFIRDFISLVGNDLSGKGIDIKMNMVAGEEFTGITDPRALQQVMLNLITNAVDALEGRPLPQIEIDLERIDGDVEIRIKDNGCGMTDEQKKDLFKPFVTSKEKGTGLGLVIVKKMLTRMETGIRVESLRNSGTTFTIEIPGGDLESANP